MQMASSKAAAVFISFSCSLPSTSLAKRHQKNCTLAFRVGRKKLRHVIIEKRKAGGAEPLRICGEIHLAAKNPSLELHRSISASTKAFEDRTKVGKKEDIGSGTTEKTLLKTE